METADQQSSPAILPNEEVKDDIEATKKSDPTQNVDLELQQSVQSGDSTVPIENADSISLKPEPVPNTPASTSESASKQPTDQVSEAPPKPTVKPKENNDRSKEDEKLAMYKALAIKLKKELVKSRDELNKLKESSQAEKNTLVNKVDSLGKTLDIERQTHETSLATLEAKVRTLQQQLDSTGAELQSLQSEFESYKVMASKIMQQNPPTFSSSNKTFEEERYKQLKKLSDDQKKRISHLESQLESSTKKNDETSRKSQQLQENLDKLRERLKVLDTIAERCEILTSENDNLKSALSQFRRKLKEPRSSSIGDEAGQVVEVASICDRTCNSPNAENENKEAASSTSSPTTINNSGEAVSPSASLKDESQTNSSSSYDGSTSGYVHIKPATFEIISRSSVLDDAQNQIDNLTKAYLDSESTNSLLTEQVKALKDEIRRLQRGSERLVLAENLEYLKNVVFKFLSLDSSQVEQKKRLIPVLSTVLKLSPDETAKLNTLAVSERPSMASSFFKL